MNRSFCAPYCPGHRKVLIYALVWASMVVVFTILFENATKVALIEDQDRVQTLLTNRANHRSAKAFALGA
jgi:hypothetical protein